MDVNDSKTKYEDYYKSVSSFMSTSPGNRWVFTLLDKLLKNIPANSVQSILDVGCGEGSKTFFLKTRFKSASILGVDFSSSGIEAAKGLGDCEGLEFRLSDVEDSSIWEAKYDMVSSFEVLEHIDDWKSLVDKFTSCSTNYVLLSFPVGRMRKYEINLGHVRNFKKGEVENYLAEKGFYPVEVFYAGFPFFSPISRDLMNFLFKCQQEHIENVSEPTVLTKLYSKTLYFLFKYCSTKRHFGEQFLGLFHKDAKSLM